MAVKWALLYDPTGRLRRVETRDFGGSGILGVSLWTVGSQNRRDVYITANDLAGMLVLELEQRKLLTSEDG